MEGIEDASVPASLLKFWFRELEEPIIDTKFYDECIKVRDKEGAQNILNKLDNLNRIIVLYMIKFLQVI